MAGRFVSIWFRHLMTDGLTIREPQLGSIPFVLKTTSHGRVVITAANAIAQKKGIEPGMAFADSRAIVPRLQGRDEEPGMSAKLLQHLAEWCIRFTPIVAVDLPDGLFLDATGCTHLWGGEKQYLNDIVRRLETIGYNARSAIADTPGAAWAIARFGQQQMIVESSKHVDSLLPLPGEALRIEKEIAERLHKLGLRRIAQFTTIPRHALLRRFGPSLIRQLDLAMGKEPEILTPVETPEPFRERLHCLEPIVTAKGIEIALQELLHTLCFRLQQTQLGARKMVFKCYRVDGKVEEVRIGTHRPSHHISHLFKLFELKLSNIEPALGIELFVLEVITVEEHAHQQERLFEIAGGLNDASLSELVDRLSARVGIGCVHRYLPVEHYWPERSYRSTTSLNEHPASEWLTDKLRPLELLSIPQRIEVTAPIPDYPPMLFRHRGKIHNVVRADGPERIEQEWWTSQGEHRDYYRVEDEDGNRYWLYRLGHYDEHNRTQWFLHGYFS